LKDKTRRTSEKKKLFWPLVKILLEVTKENKDPKEILESMYLFCSESVESGLEYIKTHYPDSYEEVVKRKNEKESITTSRISQYIDKLRDTKILFSDRLKYLCETQELTDDEKKLVASQASESFDKYYNLVGPERCKALGYHTTKINKDLLDSLSDSLITSDMIFSEISKFFQVGKKYTNKETKETIREIFNRLGYSKSPKASILNDFYELKMTKALSKEGKWENGFEILGLKP